MQSDSATAAHPGGPALAGSGASRLPNLGLVLEGGGMRGLFTAGVLDALFAAGIRFDGIMGVSAGAAFESGLSWEPEN